MHQNMKPSRHNIDIDARHPASTDMNAPILSRSSDAGRVVMELRERGMAGSPCTDPTDGRDDLLRPCSLKHCSTTQFEGRRNQCQSEARVNRNFLVHLVVFRSSAVASEDLRWMCSSPSPLIGIRHAREEDMQPSNNITAPVHLHGELVLVE